MNTVKYSIIVPVYNVEKVLGRCIDSILAQTITDFELILVNDGSTDDSGAICDDYKNKDNRIRVIHQENGGVSKARNTGIDIAQGKYIVFVDSDDAVMPHHIEAFDRHDEDLVISKFSMVKLDGKIVVPEMSNANYINMTEDVIIDILKRFCSSLVWGKRYKTSIIKDNNLYFDEQINYMEDTLFVAQYISFCINCKVNEEMTYTWYEQEGMSLSKVSENIKYEIISLVQNKIFDAFSKSKQVQNYLAEKYCWVTEQEIVKVCNNNMSKRDKLETLKTILHNSFLDECVKIRNNLSLQSKLIFKLKSPVITLWKYSK